MSEFTTKHLLLLIAFLTIIVLLALVRRSDKALSSTLSNTTPAIQQPPLILSPSQKQKLKNFSSIIAQQYSLYPQEFVDKFYAPIASMKALFEDSENALNVNYQDPYWKQSCDPKSSIGGQKFPPPVCSPQNPCKKVFAGVTASFSNIESLSIRQFTSEGQDGVQCSGFVCDGLCDSVGKLVEMSMPELLAKNKRKPKTKKGKFVM